MNKAAWVLGPWAGRVHPICGNQQGAGLAPPTSVSSWLSLWPSLGGRKCGGLPCGACGYCQDTEQGRGTGMVPPLSV